MKKFTHALALLAFQTSMVHDTRAEDITWRFEGMVDSADNPPFHWADKFVAQISFEPKAVPSSGFNVHYHGALSSIQVDIGGMEFSRPGSFNDDIAIANDQPGGDLIGFGFAVQLANQPLMLLIGLSDNQADLFDFPDQIGLPPHLSDLEWKDFRIYSLHSELAWGRLTALTLVPEPGTLSVLVLGTILILRNRHQL